MAEGSDARRRRRRWKEKQMLCLTRSTTKRYAIVIANRSITVVGSEACAQWRCSLEDIGSACSQRLGSRDRPNGQQG